mgnify:FL=1|tara:strand:+ start:343 stop:498 length:156 start_codon:yes stop_codon:yes gene_type:complete
MLRKLKKTTKDRKKTVEVISKVIEESNDKFNIVDKPLPKKKIVKHKHVFGN